MDAMEIIKKLKKCIFFSKNSEILLSLLETLFCVYPNVFEHRESFRTTGRHTLLSQCKMLMCQLSVYLYAEGAPVPSLLHICREPTDTKYWSQCFWCVNCQHICQQKMHLWTVPSLLHMNLTFRARYQQTGTGTGV